MSDEQVRAEVRRRRAAGEPEFQEGDLVTVTAEHAHGLPDKDYFGRVSWDASTREFKVSYSSTGGYQTTCYHYDQWTLVRPAARV